jgi:hypothetical protein
MIWLLRRLLGSLLVATAICTALVFAWVLPTLNTGPALTFSDVAMGYFIMLPFAVVGMILLLPIALALRSLALPEWIHPLLIIVVGAALGIVVVFPIGNGPPLQDFTLATACGAASALVWLAFNRDRANRRL